MLKYGNFYSSDKINYKHCLNYNSAKNSNYSKYCILSLITKNVHRKISNATNDTNLANPFAFDYDINDIKKLDESSISLSDISDLDLDAGEEMLKKRENSFNSSNDDINQSDEEEVKIISKKKIKKKSIDQGEDVEFEKQLENDLIEIRKELSNRRRCSVQVDYAYFKKSGF